MMTATLPVTADQLAIALDQARHARHHPDCRCATYRCTSKGDEGAPYCTPLEKRWCDRVNELIDKARQENHK